MTPRPTLDYRPRLDERNRAYRVTAAPDLAHKPRTWTPGVCLDQGQEGSCVGHGVTGEWLASPVRGRVANADAGHKVAVGVYDRAKEIDEFEGVDYDGTSVRAGMLVGRERGWYSGFGWAFNMAELRTALEQGPVVIGVEWTDGAYDAPGGELIPTGPVVGGHCLIVTGYSPSRHVGALTGPAYRLRNSWSRTWGSNGSAYIAAPNLDRILFSSGGEAAVPQGRHM